MPAITLRQYLQMTPALSPKTAAEVVTAVNAKTVIKRTTYWATYNQLILDFGVDAARGVAALMDSLAAQDPLMAKLDRSLSNNGVDVSLDVTQAQLAAISARLPDGDAGKTLVAAIMARGQTTSSVADANGWGTVTEAQVNAARDTIANIIRFQRGATAAMAAINNGASFADAMKLIV